MNHTTKVLYGAQHNMNTSTVMDVILNVLVLAFPYKPLDEHPSFLRSVKCFE